MTSQLFKTVAILAMAILPSLAFSTAHAEIDLSKDFDSLGGNEKLYKRAKALDPHNRVSIVQKRVVDRNYRLELGGNLGMVAGGDPYLRTKNLGANVDFHINPRWSVGGRYATHYNELTSEGRSVMEDARRKKVTGDLIDNVPSIDHPEQTVLGTVTWYPVYGKTNLFDLAVIQFDLYTLAGYGQVQLESGWTDAFTAGGGIGFWLSQHVASRLEGRWQTHEDYSYAGSRRLHTAIVTMSLGVML